MFSLLNIKSFFNFNDLIGIEIDNNSIKLVQIKVDGKNNVLKKADIFPLLKNSITEGKMIDEENLKETIQKAYKKLNFSSKKVTYTIPEKNVFHYYILSSHYSEKKIDELVQQKISAGKKELADNFYYTWKIADYFKKEDENLIEISFVTKSIIKKINKIFTDLNLEVRGCDFKEKACLNFLNDYYFDKSFLVIDIGSEKSTFMIYEKNKIKLATTSSFSYNLICDILAKTLNISSEQVEKITKNQDIGAVFNDDYFFKAIQPIVDGIILEVKNLEDFYSKSFLAQPMEEILVIGEGEKLKGLGKYLAYQLNKKEVFLSQNQNLSNKKSKLKSDKLTPYLVAIGATLS